jgi:hypothetical protein
VLEALFFKFSMAVWSSVTEGRTLRRPPLVPCHRIAGYVMHAQNVEWRILHFRHDLGGAEFESLANALSGLNLPFRI